MSRKNAGVNQSWIPFLLAADDTSWTLTTDWLVLAMLRFDNGERS